MKYRTLGRTGVRVSPLCLGTMMFGAWGNRDHDDGVRVVHRALDAGVNFVDTADIYSAGESEEIVGKAIAGRRDDLVLATKFRVPMGEEPNHQGGSRRWIVRAVEDSLRRLGTDRIDLYQMHRPDPHCEIDESLAALDDLVRAGKVLYVGSSTFPAHEMVEAQWAAERRNLVRFVCEQPPYSILTRGVEADVLPVARKYGMGVIPWGPLSAGYLSGRFRKGVEPQPTHRDMIMGASGRELTGPAQDAKRAAAEELGELAAEHGLTLIEMALAFVLNHPAVTSVIIGPRTMEQLESQLSAPDVALPVELLDKIDEIVPPGTTLNPQDVSYSPPALGARHRRR